MALPKTLADSWELFSAILALGGASGVQQAQMRKAFYAGADWMALRSMEFADLGEDAGATAYGAVMKELNDFKMELISDVLKR